MSRDEARFPPSGCHWCGLSERDHPAHRWSERRKSIHGSGWHAYEPPNFVQIKGRMQARRLSRGLPVPSPWGPIWPAYPGRSRADIEEAET